ncbi:MAG: TonB-dependent receptor [Pyrinomonadaceae bacterium]
MNRIKNISAALFFCLTALTGAAFSQGTTGQITGTVTDQNGAIVRGAAVTATSLDTNFSRTQTTGDDGVYAFQLLPPGRYRVSVSASGFRETGVEVVVNITQTTAANITLGVGGIDDNTVVVTADTPVLQNETSQTGRVVEGETIRQLPLPTRNFQQLLTLQAGAQSSVSNNTELGRGDSTITVNGQRTTSNSVRINGVDANSIGTNSTPNIAVPASDSLQEFIVQTSLYDASNGRNAGGNVEAVTRSGSNNFHGNVYYFLRDENLNANEPFIKARGVERPVLSRHQYGGTLGGPIKKDRVFFFGSYQGTRERNGLSLLNSLTFPSIPLGLTDTNRNAADLMAAFGVAAVNPVSLAILNARLPDGSFAIPSSGATGAPANCPLALLGGNANRCPVSTPQTGISRFRENQFNANLDFNISARHTFAGKIFFADNPTTQANYNFAGLGNGSNQLIGFGGDLAIKQTLLSFTDTYIVNSNISNQARFGFNRLLVTSVPQEPFTAADLGITSPLQSLFPGAPTLTVAGLDANFAFGSSVLADQSSRINAYTLADTVSIVSGKHRFRVGAEFRHSTVKFYFNSFSRGQVIFSSFNNFLTGTGTSIIGSGIFDRSFRVKDLSAFVQDDWKLTDRLTLNLGLRYDFYGLPVEEQGRLVNLLTDQLAVGTTAAPAPPPNGLVQAEGGQLQGVPTVEKTLVPTDKNNFAPRIGFAYRLDGNGKAVIRGGYGIYYDRISTRFANTQLFNFPYLALGIGLPGLLRTFSDPFVPVPQPSAFPTAATIPSPLGPIAPFVGVPVSGVFVDPELQTPYVQQFNLGVQWEFAKNTVLEVGYVGNKGTHLLQIITLNQPVYNAATNSFSPRLAAGSIISANKNVTGGVQQVQTTSNSNYNSLQVSLTRRFNRGLQVLGAYTYGRSFDYYSGASINELTNIPGDQLDWSKNYGRSDFNREHRLVISGVYDLPKTRSDSKWAKAFLNDWQIAGIAVFQSGLPFSVIDNPGNAVISRANYNPAFSGQIYTAGNVSDRLGGYFNAGAFVTSRPRLDGTGVGAVNNPTFDPNAPFGNTPRNFLTGPGQKNIDFSIIKLLPFNERLRGEVRAEMFNVFNWVNYANPVNNIALGNFGQITSASTGPRVIQLGFKLSF